MEAFEKLEEKINKAVALIDKLSDENKLIKSENDSLKKELAEAKSKMVNLERSEAERADTVKEKLNNIMNKLGALDQL
jgi:FtsZ-binding cell division protein ZapB